jgi:hypothetical protein
LKKIVLSFVLLSSYAFDTLCMEKDEAVTLPSAKILTVRFNKLQGFDQFNEKTGLANELGDKKYFPVVIALKTDLALNTYFQHKSKDPETVSVHNRSILLEAILQDNPTVIENLKNHGVIPK